MVFLRAFSRALKILWSHGVVFFMSSARSRAVSAVSAVVGRSGLGEGGIDGGSTIREGGFSTGIMFTASITASAASSGSGGDGEGVEATGGVGTALGGLISFWLAGLETGGAGVSISSWVSLSGVETSGDGISGIKAGGAVKSGEAGIVEGGVISTAALLSGKAGMSGRRAFGAETFGSVGESPNSEGTGMSGACPGASELGLSRMGSARISPASFFDFLKPRKLFFVGVPLGGGMAGTSSALLSLCNPGSSRVNFLPFSFFCF